MEVDTSLLLGNAYVTDESEAEESALIQGPEHGGTRTHQDRSSGARVHYYTGSQRN